MSLTYETVTYQTIANTNFSDIGNGNLSIAKPTGLAVGDLMIAAVAATVNGHSAWASNDGMTEIYDNAANDHGIAVYKKIATASDVSASNFTFTPTNLSTANLAGGFILRFSGAGGVQSPSTATNVGITSLSPASITPTYANSLFVLISSEGNNNPTTFTVSGQSMATSNPTWTERVDNGGTSGGNGCSIAVATSAVRPEATATGTFNVTFSGTTDRAFAVALCISPKINGADAPTSITLNGYNLSPIPKTDLDAIVPEPTIYTGNNTPWTTIPKS